MKLDLIDYADLPTGETRNGTCPSCGRKKFYVTRKNDGLAYICFRASCHTQGFAHDYHAPAENRLRPLTTYRKNYEWTGKLLDATWDDVMYFEEQFGVTELETDEEIRYWLRRTDDGRYAFPLWGPDDRLRGHVIRRKPTADAPIVEKCNDGMPKALTYIHPDVPRCGWYHSGRESIVVIVEDCISAMRIASLGFTAVALLGTYMPPKVIEELLKWKNGRTYILALDPDAIEKALDIAATYGAIFPGGLRVVNLQYDPKDYPIAQMLLEDLNLIN